ncbi:MAG: ParM/StbA family protein [Lachnospiraceae bacterium]|nr:ParM/StbA family protein [Lachnospiraceae bacterium]
MTAQRCKDKTLAIGIDPGFDSTKVVVNGTTFLIDKDVVESTGGMLGKKKDNYYKCTYEDGKEYYIGSYARSAKTEKEKLEEYARKESFINDYSYFETFDFEISTIAAIGIALTEYEKDCKKMGLSPAISTEKSLNDWKIYLGVALPHGVYEKYTGLMKQKFAKLHSFLIENSEKEYSIKFDIKPENVIVYSQAQCALIGAFSDENGIPDYNSVYFKKLPLLLIDGGYKTMGIFKFTRINTTTGGESNTEYAMSNAVERAVERLNQMGAKQVTRFNLEVYINEYDGMVNTVKEDGSVEQVDAKQILNEEIEKTVDGFVDYLNEKYDNMIDIMQILLTGGTGACYYEYFKKKLEEKKSHLKGNIRLTEYEFYGKPINPVFGVAVGMYKIVMNRCK